RFGIVVPGLPRTRRCRLAPSHGETGSQARIGRSGLFAPGPRCWGERRPGSGCTTGVHGIKLGGCLSMGFVFDNEGRNDNVCDDMNISATFLEEAKQRGQASGRLSDEEYLTVAEAAQALRISTSTIWRWINAGDVHAYRVGHKRVRIKASDVRQL